MRDFAQLWRAAEEVVYSTTLAPVAVGDGAPALPRDRRLALELLGERRFGRSVVYLRYRGAAA